MEPVFMPTTLRDALMFYYELQGLEREGTLPAVKAYVLRGEALPSELKAQADALVTLRREAIRAEMNYLAAQTAEKGITLPSDFLDGTALDPVAQPKLCAIWPNFQVPELFSWYDPSEAALFTPRKVLP